MKKIKFFALTIWFLFNLILGIFLSANLVGIMKVNAQDLTPPEVTIISPEATTYFTISVDLNFTVNEETDWIGYSLDSADNITITGNVTLTDLSDGTHNVAVYANDTALNTGMSDVDFTVSIPDTTPPIITIDSPEATTYSTSSVDLNFTVNEDTSWIGYSLDGVDNVTISGNTTLDDLSEGSHSVIVYANDTTGNMGESNVVYFSVDTTPPTITIISPEYGKTYNTKNVPLEFTINEEVSWIGYSLDDTENITIATNTTMQGLSKYLHTVVVYANDTAGNMGSSEYIFFYVQITDESPPIILVTSPENSTYSVSTLNLNFTVNEETDWIGYSLDDADNITIAEASSLTDFSVPLTDLSDGSHNVVVFANDTSSNTGKSNTVYFSVDTTPPVIVIDSPENITYSTSSVDLTFTVDEETFWIGYSLDGESNITISENTALNSLSEGSHRVVVFANDTAGNMGESSIVYFSVDTTPPTIIVSSPTSSIYSTSGIPLIVSVNEETSWMGYSLDGQNNITISGDTIISGLSDGLHHLVVYANDTVGNMGVSSTVNFVVQIPQVDTTPPTIIITSPKETTYSTSEIDLTFTINEPVSWRAYSLDGEDNVTITGNTVLSGLSDEEHSIRIFARDNSGNTGVSNIVTFKIDTTPPIISLNSPEETTYSTTNVFLDFTLNEEVTWIGYSLDEQDNVTITADLMLSGLSEGSHSIAVFATDLAGNTGASSTIQFTISIPPVDTNPPIIVITSPESTTYTVTMVVLDFAINEATSWIGYSLDGQDNVTITGNIVLSGLSEGSHNVIVFATDSAGNTGASDLVQFAISIPPVDTTPPTVTIISPENTTYEVSFVLLDIFVNEQVSWIGYSLDGDDNVTITGDTVLSSLSEGSHSVVVFATDLAGNTGASNIVQFAFSIPPVDTIPPTVVIASPENITYTNTTVALDFEINEQVSWIGYSLDGDDNVTIAGNVTLSGLSEGSHNVVVYANDTALNTGMSEIAFTISIPDITPPIITIISPRNSTYRVTSVDLNFTVNEETSWIGYSLDGQDNFTIVDPIVLTDLADGEHRLIIYAEDLSGNIGTSDLIVFTISTENEIPSQLWAVAVIAIIAGTGFIFSTYIAYDLFKSRPK